VRNQTDQGIALLIQKVIFVKHDCCSLQKR